MNKNRLQNKDIHFLQNTNKNKQRKIINQSNKNNKHTKIHSTYTVYIYVIVDSSNISNLCKEKIIEENNDKKHTISNVQKQRESNRIFNV